MRFLDMIGQPFSHALIKVITAQMIIAGAGQDLYHAVFNFNDGDVKRAAQLAASASKS
mgnify:CR=1 FL=1